MSPEELRDRLGNKDYLGGLSRKQRKDIELLILDKTEPTFAAYLTPKEALLWKHMLKTGVSSIAGTWRVGAPLVAETLPTGWREFLRQKKSRATAADIVRLFELLMEVGLLQPIGEANANRLQTCAFTIDPHRVMIRELDDDSRLPAEVSSAWRKLGQAKLTLPKWFRYATQIEIVGYFKKHYGLEGSDTIIWKRLVLCPSAHKGGLGLVLFYPNGAIIPCWPGLAAATFS